MLEDCLVASRPSARTKKPFTLLLSVITHGVLGALLVLIPLFQSQVLPQVPIFLPLRPPTIAARSIELVRVSKPSSGSNPAALSPPKPLIVPPPTPNRILKTIDDPGSSMLPFIPSIGGNDTGLFSSSFNFGDEGRVTPPPLPPPKEPSAPPRAQIDEPAPRETIRRISRMDPSSLLYSVKPTYPRLAVMTRVQGAVQLEAVIMREGTIDPTRIRVISGHVLLVPAALEAVQQWRYRPTLLNGEPVEVLTTITVNFTLN